MFQHRGLTVSVKPTETRTAKSIGSCFLFPQEHEMKGTSSIFRILCFRNTSDSLSKVKTQNRPGDPFLNFLSLIQLNITPLFILLSPNHSGLPPKIPTFKIENFWKEKFVILIERSLRKTTLPGMKHELVGWIFQ
jgi:hypothetical protein